MSWLLLILSISLAVFKSSLYNAYAKKEQPGIGSTFRFNAAAYGMAAVIALVAVLFADKSLSRPTIFCALGYAVIVFLLQTVSVTAMRVGTMALTSVCVMYGMIIPSLAGPLFWHEKLGALQIIGILMMLASLWLLRGKPEKNSGTITKKWILLAAAAFVLSGMAGVMEKIHQSTPGRSEKAGFVLTACLFMLGFSVVSILIVRKTGRDGRFNCNIAVFGAVSGAVIGIYSIVNLSLAGLLDSMIYYPVANGGAMLLTVLVSFAAFKEPLDKYKIAGTVLGLCGIAALSIPV